MNKMSIRINSSSTLLCHIHLIDSWVIPIQRVLIIRRHRLVGQNVILIDGLTASSSLGDYSGHRMWALGLTLLRFVSHLRRDAILPRTKLWQRQRLRLVVLRDIRCLVCVPPIGPERSRVGNIGGSGMIVLLPGIVRLVVTGLVVRRSHICGLVGQKVRRSHICGLSCRQTTSPSIRDSLVNRRLRSCWMSYSRRNSLHLGWNDILPGTQPWQGRQRSLRLVMLSIANLVGVPPLGP
mmetsp:Transcript_2537/g.4571  ORF Transcript_2537/g.4571 Transcript_2537/m.4571 type:complete len:237 (+) Transcript_2537:1294-2004(+)